MWLNVTFSDIKVNEKYIKTHSNHFRGINQKGYRYKLNAAGKHKKSREGCDFEE